MTIGQEQDHYVTCACAWPIPPLLRRCNLIGCTHDSAWGQDYHVFCKYAKQEGFFFKYMKTSTLHTVRMFFFFINHVKNIMLSDYVFTEGVFFLRVVIT